MIAKFFYYLMMFFLFIYSLLFELIMPLAGKVALFALVPVLIYVFFFS
jgi:hypothetical protein